MAFVARSCCSCCCLVRVQAYTQHTLAHTLPCSSHVALHFFVCAPSSDTARELRNKSPYIYIAYSIYTRTNCMLYIYNFFHSCLSFCVMRFALLRFGPHVLWLCVSLVLLKNSRLSLCAKHQRHIKAFPGIKISHEPRLTSIPPTFHPSQPSIHPSFLPSTQPVSYPSHLWHFVLMLE